MVKSTFSVVAAAAFGLVLANPAAAAVKVATYTGSVITGYDTTGVFGVANTSLVGATWTAQYTYDRSLSTVNFSGSNYDSSYGGTDYGGPSPIIAATITINGVTRSIPSDTYAEASVGEYFVLNAARRDTIIATTLTSYQLVIYGELTGGPTQLEQNFGPVALTNGAGYFAYKLQNTDTGVFTHNAEATFGNITSYQISDVAAVPEPASWAMLIAGFGLVGATSRRRRAVAA
jgi:hypothetical protein